MNNKQILKGENRYKGAYDSSNTISVNLDNTVNNLPVEEVYGNVNEYEQYLSEKNNSDKYRFVFTIKPYCSNVLFNSVSEIVYKEGSDDCIVFGKNGASKTPDGELKDTILKYQNYKGSNNLNSNWLKRYELIRDTAYSHSDIGPLVYHCGYDIFNNHILRQNEFTVVNKMISGDTIETEHKKYFNTIEDYLRSYDGKEVEDVDMRLKENKPSDGEKIHKKLYKKDSLYSFNDCMKYKVNENNGWFGFNNNVGLDIPNYITDEDAIVINKCMNNNKANEQIDFYPDRSLYSFIPKKNKYRKRLEYNWDYCLTYPYANFYDNDIVRYKTEDGKTIVNGIECFLDTEIKGKEEIDGTMIDPMEGKHLRFHTIIKNTFEVEDLLQFYFIYTDGSVVKCLNKIQITSIGYNSDYSNYYFTIKYDEIEHYLQDGMLFRIRKVINGLECDYYFRKFRRLPNFKHTDVYSDGKVTEEEISDNCLNDFSNNLNNLAFEKTIFSDIVSQIVYNDDIRLNGLKDNIGRELSEIYLTIVKTNRGYKEWYENKKYNSEKVEFSHCFGKISSGLDLPNGIEDYNIHLINNVDINKGDLELFKPLNLQNHKKYERLEDDITISGDSETHSFLGDIVEYSITEIQETVLEDVYHRFNTVQREIIDGEFSDIIYDEVLSDEDDFINTNGLDVVQRYYNAGYNSATGDLNEGFIDKFYANISPEGYYYKPHYKIKLKEFSTEVQQGSHTKIIHTLIGRTGNTFEIKTSANYYLSRGEKLTVYTDEENYEGVVLTVGGKLFNEIKFAILAEKEINYNTIFKRNILKPDNAIELDDGTGIYLWRDKLKSEEITNESELYDSIFMNGSHYFKYDINFYLRRQDPQGEYGLSYEKSNTPNHSQIMTVYGKHKDIDEIDYVKEDRTACITI